MSNKELLKQGYLGPVKSTAMIHNLRGVLADGTKFNGMSNQKKNEAIRKILDKELRKLRASDTLVEKVVTGEGRGQKHYYKEEHFVAYVKHLESRLRDEYGVPRF